LLIILSSSAVDAGVIEMCGLTVHGGVVMWGDWEVVSPAYWQYVCQHTYSKQTRCHCGVLSDINDCEKMAAPSYSNTCSDVNSGAPDISSTAVLCLPRLVEAVMKGFDFFFRWVCTQTHTFHSFPATCHDAWCASAASLAVLGCAAATECCRSGSWGPGQRCYADAKQSSHTYAIHAASNHGPCYERLL
jgi:hypothetical protein